jgi:hypothetical protein
VRQRYDALSRALLAGASAQLSNEATTGGTGQHANLRRSSRLFTVKTNLSCPPAALPAVLQLPSLDSETLFNGNPGPDVLNCSGGRAHIFAMHDPAEDAAEDAPRNACFRPKWCARSGLSPKVQGARLKQGAGYDHRSGQQRSAQLANTGPVM